MVTQIEEGNEVDDEEGGNAGGGDRRGVPAQSNERKCSIFKGPLGICLFRVVSQNPARGDIAHYCRSVNRDCPARSGIPD